MNQSPRGCFSLTQEEINISHDINILICSEGQICKELVVIDNVVHNSTSASQWSILLAFFIRMTDKEKRKLASVLFDNT